jgi:hypothetical protein
MRLPRDEGRWRSPEFASDRRCKGNPESTARALDVARGRDDGGSVFCPIGSLVHLRREFRRSCNGAELRRGCFRRGCLSARTCNPSTLARSLAGCHRRRTGVFRQELAAPIVALKGVSAAHSPKAPACTRLRWCRLVSDAGAYGVVEKHNQLVVGWNPTADLSSIFRTCKRRISGSNSGCDSGPVNGAAVLIDHSRRPDVCRRERCAEK